MNARRRIPRLTIVLLLLSLPVGGLIAYWLHPADQQTGWTKIGLPGSQERIAAFPELVKLTANETRPAGDLPALPFALDETPGAVAAPGVERQTLLGADSFAPRAPKAIIAADAARSNLTAAEADVLVGAYLDLGRVDEAIAARRARVQHDPQDESAQEALIGVLDGQNRVDEALTAIDAYFSLLLEKGRTADEKERGKKLERARRLLDQRTEINRRALRPQTGVDEARLRLLDAFPENGELAAAYARELLDNRRYDELIAALEPRVDRYQENRWELWDLLAKAYEKRGRLDPLLQRLEEQLAAEGDDSLRELYGNVLRRTNLIESRRKQLADALQARPDTVALCRLVNLDLAIAHYEPARTALEQTLPRVAAGATAPQLLSLADLTHSAGMADQSARLAADVALLAGDDPKLLLAAATRLNRGAALAWPLANSPAQAFQPGFADRQPGVAGGLLSLGTNRMDAPAALKNMPATGNRYANRQQAVRLAYRALELFPDAPSAFPAAGLLAETYRDVKDPDRLDKLADQLAARFGDRQPRLGHILQWKADAARIRQDKGAEIAALRQALAAALRLDEPADAAEIQQRLIALLLKEKRYPEVLALKWERVERYPQDEAAMRDLLKFTEENKLFADEERAYRRALEQFDRRAWSDKFARWLLRQERRQDFEALVLDAAAKLGENELSKFMQNLVGEESRQKAGDLFFEKAYIVALGRFPADVGMSRRLLDFYESKGWNNGGEVVYQDKFIDLGMRVFALDAAISRRLTQRLAQRGMIAGLRQRLAANRTVRPVELLLWTRLQEHESQYEAVRQGYAALDGLWPKSPRATLPLAVTSRSLADSYRVRDVSLYAQAATAYGQLADRSPLETENRVSQGETLLEAGRPRDAVANWEKLIAAAPGDANRWLELATLYWDYYRPVEAKNTIADARRTLTQPELFAKEMAYLLEDEGRIDAAVDELVIVVLNQDYSAGMYEAKQRLDYLVRARKTTDDTVDTAFWRRLERPEGKSEEGLAYLQWRRDRNQVEAAKRAAYRLLPKYGDTVFAEGANEMFVTYGDDPGVKACLERLLAISNHDPVMVQRLVVYHENRRETAEADRLVRELVDRAADSSARAAARRFAADYFWRTERRATALSYYRLLAQEGEDYGRTNRWLVYADRCLEDDRPDDALAALAELRRVEPTDATIVGAMAKAYAAKNDRAGLVAFYQDVLKNLRDAQLSSDTKKDREIELRGKLIEALTALKQPRDAVEEHIKIINRLAPDPAPVLAALRYAKRYDQTAPLLAYYEREAARANRDFRWQYVTALLYEGLGRYAEAAAMMDKAVANEPQRIDLLEKRAQLLIKAGDFDQAIAVYRTLDSRRLSGVDYQQRVAEVLYLANRPEQAEQWLNRMLAAPDVDVSRVVAAARLAERFNRPYASRGFAVQAMNLILDQPDSRQADGDFYWLWLRGCLETGGIDQAIVDLDGVRRLLQTAREKTHPIGRKKIDETLAKLDALSTSALASWLGQFADGPARAKSADLFASLLRQSIPADPAKRQEAFGKAVRAAYVAMLPAVADQLARDQLRDLDAQLASATDKPKIDAQLAALLRQQAKTRPWPALLADALALPNGSRETATLAEQAVLARANGDSREAEILGRLYGRGTDRTLRRPQPLQSRYFGLLGDAPLDQLVNGPYVQPGPLTYWLAEQGQTARLVAALTNHYRDQDPRWLLSKKALAYQADPAFAKQAREADAELLGLPLQIGRRLDAKPAPGQVKEKLWTHYAAGYANWLLSQNDPAGLPLLYAGPERHPLSADAYLQAATDLDRAGRYPAAETFLEQAAQLAAGDEMIVARALHLSRQGKNGAAADLLETLIAKPDTPLPVVRRYAELMAQVDRAKDGLNRWREILLARLPLLTTYARRDAAGEWLSFARQNLGDHWTAKQARDLLADASFSAADLSTLIDEETVPPALTAWLRSLVLERAGGDVRLTVYARRGFAEAALADALTARDKKLAQRALGFLAANDPGALEESETRLQRLRAAVYFEKPETAEALAKQFVKDTTDQNPVETIRQLFVAERRVAAADRVWLAFYEPIRNDEAKLERWDNENDLTRVPVSAAFVADLRSLEAFLRLGDRTAAEERLIELEEAAGEDESGLIELAKTLRSAGQFPPAVRLADKAAALAPGDAAVLAERIRAHLAAGQSAAAAQFLSVFWRQGSGGQFQLDGLLYSLASIAAQTKPQDWRTAAQSLPSELRPFVLAHLELAVQDGAAAARNLAALPEPLRYPAMTWRLRAAAYRLTGDEAAEMPAVAAYLLYQPYDGQFARRLAWLELKATPFRGLARLAYLGLPLSPWQRVDSLESAGKANELKLWLASLPVDEQNHLVADIARSFAKIDWPAAGAQIGEASLALLGDQATDDLRQVVSRLQKQVADAKAARPRRFIPTDQLAQ